MAAQEALRQRKVDAESAYAASGSIRDRYQAMVGRNDQSNDRANLPGSGRNDRAGLHTGPPSMLTGRPRLSLPLGGAPLLRESSFASTQV